MNESILHLGLLEDEAIGLDVAALQIAALDHEDADLDAYGAILSNIAERLADLGGAAMTAAARAKMLARVIAVEHEFEGDRETYDDPDNADLIRVVDRRRGLPVSLSIIYVAAARRLGWQAEILNTPGHVLARIGPSTAPVLIDPFGGGGIVGSEQLAALLSQALGRIATPSAEHLTPMSNRSALVRLLMNQASRAEAAGDTARALTVYERMTIIAPAHSRTWWERARLELAVGEIAAARASLSAMLETTREPATRARVSAALHALSA